MPVYLLYHLVILDTEKVQNRAFCFYIKFAVGVQKHREKCPLRLVLRTSNTIFQAKVFVL